MARNYPAIFCNKDDIVICLAKEKRGKIIALCVLPISWGHNLYETQNM